MSGTNGDVFPNDASRCYDTDGDGISDEDDLCAGTALHSLTKTDAVLLSWMTTTISSTTMTTDVRIHLTVKHRTQMDVQQVNSTMTVMASATPTTSVE